MRIFCLLLASILPASVCFAQKNAGTYDWGVGIKYQPIAVSVKKYIKAGDAFEFLLSKYDEGYRATALFELSPALNIRKTVRLIFGSGLHTGFKLSKYMAAHDSNPIFGLDAIGGVEWKLPKIPFAIQADFQPSIDIAGNDDTFLNWGGVTVRYTW